MKYVVLNTFIFPLDTRSFPRVNFGKWAIHWTGSRGITRNGRRRRRPIVSFSGERESRVALSPLGVHQRNFDCQPGHPTGTEVFIGTTSGRGLRLTSPRYKRRCVSVVSYRQITESPNLLSPAGRRGIRTILRFYRPRL